MIKVVVKRYLKPELFDEYFTVIRELVYVVRHEPGCQKYEIYRSPEQHLSVTTEQWASYADLEEHRRLLDAAGWTKRLESYLDPERPPIIKRYEKVY